MRTFGHLSCTDFVRFWNKRRESVSSCIHRWKIFKFLSREFHTSQKQLKIGYFWGGVCDEATAKMAQFHAVGIIRGLVDIPRMCLAWLSFGGGVHKATKTPNFGKILHFHFTRLQISMSPGGDTCSDLFSSTAARVFNKLTYLLINALFEPVLQCVHRYTATRVVNCWFLSVRSTHCVWCCVQWM